MKTFLIILIFLEVIFALVAFTSIFINSANTVQTTSQAALEAANNPTSENEATWSSAKAKFDRERWIKGVAVFGVIGLLPGMMAAVITAMIFRKKNSQRAAQN